MKTAFYVQLYDLLLFFRDDSTRLVEQSRCLSHLSHVYNSLHMNNRSLMAALQELNAAEEAEENLHEVSSSNFKTVQTVCLHTVAIELVESDVC